MQMRLSVMGALFALLVAAPTASAAVASADVFRARYVCEDGTHLFVRFLDQTAYVTLTDGTKLVLPQQRSGSGFWYSSGRFELRGKGRDAMWTVGRKVPVNCRAAG